MFGPPPGIGPFSHSIEPDINKMPQIIIKGIRNTIKFLIDLRSIFEYILIFKSFIFWLDMELIEVFKYT